MQHILIPKVRVSPYPWNTGHVVSCPLTEICNCRMWLGSVKWVACWDATTTRLVTCSLAEELLVTDKECWQLQVKYRYLTCSNLNILNLCHLPNLNIIRMISCVLLYWYMWLDQSEKRQHIHQLFSIFVSLWVTDVPRRLWHWSALKVLWNIQSQETLWYV